MARKKGIGTIAICLAFLSVSMSVIAISFVTLLFEGAERIAHENKISALLSNREAAFASARAAELKQTGFFEDIFSATILSDTWAKPADAVILISEGLKLLTQGKVNKGLESLEEVQNLLPHEDLSNELSALRKLGEEYQKLYLVSDNLRIKLLKAENAIDREKNAYVNLAIEVAKEFRLDHLAKKDLEKRDKRSLGFYESGVFAELPTLPKVNDGISTQEELNEALHYAGGASFDDPNKIRIFRKDLGRWRTASNHLKKNYYESLKYEELLKGKYEMNQTRLSNLLLKVSELSLSISDAVPSGASFPILSAKLLKLFG